MRRALWAETRGSVSAMAGVLLAALIGFSALAVEYGHGLLSKSENQRAADLAAISGAVVYNSTSSTTSMNSAVNAVAALNGYSGDATASLVSSPSGDGNQAVKVVVSTTDPLFLAHVLTSAANLPVNAASYAEIFPGGEPGCIMALNNSGTGITMTGGTAISAANCAVTSNNKVSVHCGDTITTQQLEYGTTLSDSCSGIKPPTGDTLKETNATVSDPLAGDSDVSTARGELSTTVTVPGAPSVPTTGHSVTFGSSAGTTATDVAAAGSCTATRSGSTWTVTCSSGGTYNFGSITVNGGVTVNFNTGNSATYNFNGAITNSGTALTFGPGTFNISQGINISGGGSPTTFGAGTFNIGPVSGSCSGPSTSPTTNYSICQNSPSIVFGGPSTFNLTGGIWVKGGATLTMGSGSSNSFVIGAAGNGDSLTQAGGALVTFGDATGSGDLFQMAGNLNDSAGGGSCITVSAAVEHDIKGYMYVSGGITLGAGTYAVSDYVSAGGGGGGGDVTCNGVTTGVNASNVTFIIGGTTTTTCADGSNQIFCLGAGYAHVTLASPACTGTPPTSTSTLDTYCGFAVIGPASGGAGADFSNGASNTKVSGIFYVPTGPVVMSGAATMGDTTSTDCLELIASQVTMTGGTATGSSCNALGMVSSGSTSTVISLVQ